MMDERLAAVGLVELTSHDSANGRAFGQIELPWFDNSKAVEVIFERDDDSESPNDRQILAFCRFVQSADLFFHSLERKLLDYFDKTRDECDLDAETKGLLFPPLQDPRDLSSLIVLTGVLVSYFDGDDWSEYIGLLMECTWDREHGLGVKLVDGDVAEIGGQEIVL